jgi:hypothetical protein
VNDVREKNVLRGLVTGRLLSKENDFLGGKSLG